MADVAGSGAQRGEAWWGPAACEASHGQVRPEGEAVEGKRER